MKKLSLLNVYNTINENTTNTYTFWRGGNLDEYSEVVAHKSGRYEFGAGLYLISKYEIAKRYSKGSRKLYQVTVEKGNEINDCFIDSGNVLIFIKHHVKGSLKKEMMERMSKHIRDGKMDASIFNNIILNSKAINSTKTSVLRQFLIDNNVDYELVNNSFGFGETMMVLYNMKKVVNVKQIKSTDEITTPDFKY